MAALVNTSGKATASSTTTITTGAVTPSGSNTAVLVFTLAESSGYANACNYTNSGGGAINDFTSADVHLNCLSNFRQAYGKAFGEIASPTSSTTVYAGFPATFNPACSIAVFLEDADQTDPFGTELVSSETAISSSPTTVSQAFTGLTSGQLVVGALYLQDFAGTPSTAAVNTGTTLVDSQASADVENAIVTIYAVKGTADGSGNCTLSMDVTTNGAAGTMARMWGIPIVAAASGPTYTLTADGGTYSLTGTSNVLTAGRTISADSGSFVLSGTAVALTASRVLDAAGGTYSLTGQDATLTYTPVSSYELVADSGAFTYSGTDASLVVSRAIAADSGTYSYAGQNAALTYSGSAPIYIIDGHDGGSEPDKKAPDFRQYKEAKARLRKQIEAAFTSEEPSEVKEVKAEAEKVLAQVVSKRDIAKAMETIKLLESALESAQDEEDLLNILL